MTTKTPAEAAQPHRDIVLVDLGLQGGGSHGAFTWGVLDRLLEVPWLRFDGISDTSAGAMNAVVMADGYAAGGPDGARAALEKFWKRVSDGALLSPLRRGPLEILTTAPGSGLAIKQRRFLPPHRPWRPTGGD